jgi:hypothetical protein
VGTVVAVKMVDASTSTNVGNRAITLHDGAGNLLLAADSAQGGPILGLTDTSPFTVDGGTHNLVGCDENSCGKLLHYTTVFIGGPAPMELSGGQSQTVIVNNESFQLLNVGNDVYATTTWCTLQNLMPYVILRNQP